MKTYQQDDNTRIDIRLLSIYQLMRWNESGILKTDLSWNRGFHWNQEQKGKMIDSILTGIPLQTIFLKENGREMEVIDGVQRIKTILGFLNDEFPVLSENEKWNGCTYSQLKSIDQRKIEDFQVPAYILHDDESGEMAIRIFQNLCAMNRNPGRWKSIPWKSMWGLAEIIRTNSYGEIVQRIFSGEAS